MLFEEKNTIPLPEYPHVFIYFLIDNDTVVYVGQTASGISRLESHLRSEKKFNRIEILQCTQEELNELEDKFILKYKPKYNKQFNGSYMISMSVCKTMLRETFTKLDLDLRLQNITLRDIKNRLQLLNIPVIMQYNQLYIIKPDYFKLETSFLIIK